MIKPTRECHYKQLHAEWEEGLTPYQSNYRDAKPEQLLWKCNLVKLADREPTDLNVHKEGEYKCFDEFTQMDSTLPSG